MFIKEIFITSKTLTKKNQTIIETQIKMNQPKCTNETYLRPQDEGCSKHEAKQLIGKVLEKYIRNIN